MARHTLELVTGLEMSEMDSEESLGAWQR